MKDRSVMNGCDEPSRALPVEDGAQPQMPAYVAEALAGLTRTQKQYVTDGFIHGDITMRTVRALERKALFYLHPTSPNGRCGEMRLTPLGETVCRILRARRHDARDGSSPLNTEAPND